MKTQVLLLAACLAALPSVTAAQPLSLTPLGSVKSGPFRADDPRIAEINAYDASARRIYVVNLLMGRVDTIDASDAALPVAGPPLVPPTTRGGTAATCWSGCRSRSTRRA